MVKSNYRYRLLSISLLLGILQYSIAELTVLEWFQGHDSDSNSSRNSNLSTLAELSQLRVRDLRRKLTRQHGYGADEIARILDKKELIHTLLYEEHKLYQKEEKRRKKIMWKRRTILALICVVVVMFRDLWIQLYDLVSVNIVVYSDKKIYEMSRCREFNSIKGMLGVFLMMIVDCLQAWLTLSVILSWVMTSPYFFPIPSISIKPAELLATMAGSGGSRGPLSSYGVNIGPMIIAWMFRYGHFLIERWTGRKLSESYSRKRKEEKYMTRQKQRETENEDARKRKEARRAAKEERRNMSSTVTIVENVPDDDETEQTHLTDGQGIMNQLD